MNNIGCHDEISVILRFIMGQNFLERSWSAEKACVEMARLFVLSKNCVILFDDGIKDAPCLREVISLTRPKYAYVARQRQTYYKIRCHFKYYLVFDSFFCNIILAIVINNRERKTKQINICHRLNDGPLNLVTESTLIWRAR